MRDEQPFTDQALRWIGRNKQPRRSVTSIGELAKTEWDRKPMRHARALLDVAAVLRGYVDAEFRQACTLSSLQCGVLTILVNDARRCYDLRIRWLFPLLERLAASKVGGAIHDIRFRYGANGVPIGSRPEP